MIDDHVHSFGLAFEPLNLDNLTLDIEEGDEADRRRKALGPTRLVFEVLRNRLARYLRCAPEDVPLARDELAAQSWSNYVRGLMSDGGVSGMVMDSGWQGLSPATCQSYADLAGIPVWELARLEPLVDRLIKEGQSADEILASVDLFMEGAARDGAVGFKTILAYRTGLAVDPFVTLASADRALREDRAAGTAVKRSAKPLRDLVFLRMLSRCADLQLPVQIHTGFGDSEIRLEEANPLLLDEILRSSAGSSVDVVLIHASYPWHEEAGYLASVRPRVWTEFSLCNLFSPMTTADRLLRILDIAPSGRLTLGSDGHGVPETHWFGCVVLRDAWADVRERLRTVASGSWLDQTEHRIFEQNARDLYRLPGLS
jgi:hypothetical protein